MRRLVLLAGLTLALAGCQTTGGDANSSADEVALVRDAAAVAQRFMTESDFKIVRDVMPQAVAVVVLPDVVKGGFIFGAEGGNGVILARQGGGWSDPSFVSVAAGSVGFQIGGQVQDVLMIVRNRGALNALLDDGVRLGGEASVAAGPVGGGVEGAATTNLNADVIVFADAAGAFAGVALEGAVLRPRPARNADYYGVATSAEAPLNRRGADARSAGLRGALSR